MDVGKVVDNLNNEWASEMVVAKKRIAILTEENRSLREENEKLKDENEKLKAQHESGKRKEGDKQCK